MALIGCILFSEVSAMTVREMRARLNDTQAEFARRYGIPFRTVQNWESDVRTPPQYVLDLLESRVKADLANRRTVSLPKADAKKASLPKRRDFFYATEWLLEVQNRLNEPVVFALDEALMCQGNFLGHNDESILWVYGSDDLARFNGIVVLGNKISPYCVVEEDGLQFTDFNRTLADALANEPILDMQGITEALSYYYFKHGESFAGISVPPEFQDAFEQLANEAITYYDYD